MAPFFEEKQNDETKTGLAEDLSECKTQHYSKLSVKMRYIGCAMISFTSQMQVVADFHLHKYQLIWTKVDCQSKWSEYLTRIRWGLAEILIT